MPTEDSAPPQTSPSVSARPCVEQPPGVGMRNWRGQCKDWSLRPGDSDYAIQQRVIAAVSPRDPRRDRMLFCGEPGWTGHPERCRHPACRVCLARERKVRTKAAQTRFAGFEREALHSGTFLLAATDRLESTGSMLKEFRSALRNRIEYQRRRDARWQAVCLMATLEVALFRDDDLPRLPIETQQVLRDVGFPEGECGGPVWLVHAHALVYLGEVKANEVRAVLADLLPGHRRVMLRKMHMVRPVIQEIGHVVSYAHKPAFERRDPDADDGWSDFDDEELALYATWAGSPEGRFIERRFWLGPNRAWLARRRGEAAPETAEVPMPEHELVCGGQSSKCRFRISSCPRGTGPVAPGALAVLERRGRYRREANRDKQHPIATTTHARDPPA